MKSLIPKSVIDAEKRIRPYIKWTPFEWSKYLSNRASSDLFLKLENQQVSGSFKARGALNKLIKLPLEQRNRGVVTASTGNHALGVCFALKELGMTGTVFVPDSITHDKLAKLRRYPVSVELRHGGPEQVETEARRYAERHALVYVSPYNDWDVIAGQGTIGIELLADVPSLDSVFVTVGGGGLISGVAGYLKSHSPGTRIVGCAPELSPVMLESVRVGRIIQMEIGHTLSDGSAGCIEADSVTFEPCASLVDEWISVSEQEIKQGVSYAFDAHGIAIEGSAGVAVAACLRATPASRGKRAGIVICGGNVSREEFKRMLE